MKAFAHSLQVLISSPTKHPLNRPSTGKSPNTNASRSGDETEGRGSRGRARSANGNGNGTGTSHSPISPIELGSPLISGSSGGESGSTVMARGSPKVLDGGSRMGRVDAEQVGTGVLGDRLLDAGGVVQVDTVDAVDRRLVAVNQDAVGNHHFDHHSRSAPYDRLGPEGSMKSGTTIAEGSSNKENDGHTAGRDMIFVGEHTGSKRLGDGMHERFTRALPEVELDYRKNGRRPLGSLSPPMPSSPLGVVDDGETAIEPNQDALGDGGTGHRKDNGGTAGPPVPDKDKASWRSSTIGKSVKVEGRGGKRSIRDKFGLASALRGKTLGKGYRGRQIPSSTINERDSGSSGSVPFPSGDSTLHAPHRPPPLVPGSIFNRYPRQMSLVVPDVPTPMCAWPTPKIGEEGADDVDGRLSLSSSGTVKASPGGRAEEVRIFRCVNTIDRVAILTLALPRSEAD